MKRILVALVLILCLPHVVSSQSFTLSNDDSELSIFGTSTLHDWEMTSQNMSGSSEIITDNETLEVKSLKFTVVVKGLKSGKSAMDNNTYKALNEDDYPTIKYVLTKATVQSKTSSTHTLNTSGTLTISGKTRDVNMIVKATKESEAVGFQGQTTFLMSEYGVDPPTALLGTVKTGDEITIKFNVTFK